MTVPSFFNPSANREHKNKLIWKNEQIILIFRCSENLLTN